MTREQAYSIAEEIVDFWDMNSGYDGRDISREEAIEGVIKILMERV